MAVTLVFTSRIVDFRTGRILLTIDASFDALLPDEDQSGEYFEWVKEQFENHDSLVIALVMDDVFTVANLRTLSVLTEQLEAAEGVDHVVSLATANHVRADGDFLRVEPFLAELPETQDQAETIRGWALGSPIYGGNLASRDARTTALVVYVDDSIPEQEFVDRGLDLQMLAIAQRVAGDGAEVLISGNAFLRAENARMLNSDLATMLPVVVAIFGLIAFASFRSLRGVVLPLAIIVVALVWTMGLVAALGLQLNIVTTIIPVLLLTVGYAYAIHVVSDYYEALQRDPNEVAASGGPAAWGLHHVSLPLVLTGLTTAAGFVSLTLSDFPSVREFGVISVFGVLATVLVGLSLGPAVLQLLPVPERRRDSASGEPGIGRVDRWIAALAQFDLDHRRELLIAGGVVGAVALWGVFRIDVNTHLVTNFFADNPARAHFEALNRHLEGGGIFSIAIQTDIEDAFANPDNLRALEELQEWLAEQPEIGGSTSLADYVKLLNRAFHDDDPAFEKVPDDASVIKQLMLFGENDEIPEYVDALYQNAHMRVRSTTMNTEENSELLQRVRDRLARLPSHLRADVTGSGMVLSQAIDAVTRGQIQSLSLAMAFIFVVLVVMFMSLRVGLYALVPNILPILLFFGLLGLTGLPLNATTGLVACVVLGIAVDDTIHFLARFNAEARGQADERAGAIAALRAVARPVTTTSIALCIGFLVFTAGNLRNQIEFGGLAAVTLAFAWLIDVTFTPALCSGVRIVSLWDSLTYDLGEDPQRSIPVLRGLSRIQARIVALMTNVVTFPAGSRIFTAGDVGDELYVVIDGELLASLAIGGKRVEFARSRRGDTVGEIASYYGKRTADVDAVSDVRLLRFTRANLERLRNRYPRIGSRVFWNLSEVLAERAAKATERHAG
jgi:predicted RND superfamily exporter protein